MERGGFRSANEKVSHDYLLRQSIFITPVFDLIASVKSTSIQHIYNLFRGYLNLKKPANRLEE